jgi:hypothetical protein
MNRHAITWTQPSPFWTETATQFAGVTRPEFGRPAILRFTTDSFMDELLNVLETDPRRLGEYRVRPETWRGFAPPPTPLTPKKIFALPFQRLGAAKKNFRNGSPSLPTKPPPTPIADLPLKLYGPAAQRYYFVASCLICQMPGLPDRHIEPARAERASFLVRRLFPPGQDAARPKTEWEEHAWVSGPSGNFWRKLTPGEISKPAQGEERLPMFALNFKEDDLRDRRLLAGLIPVGRREAYLGGALGANGAAATGATVKTARKILFRKEIAEPWKALIAQAARATQQLADLAPPSLADRKAKIAVERSTLQSVSWLVLLDFDRFLSQYLPGVHAAIQGQTPNPPLTPEQNALLASLDQIKVKPPLLADLPGNSAVTTVSGTMIEALKQIGSFAQKLEQTTTEYDRRVANSDYPNFLFPLADPDFPDAAPLPSNSGLTAAEVTELAAAADPAHPDPGAAVDNLTVLVVRALPASVPAAEPAVPSSALTPADALDGWFVLRCAYERPACGPLHQDVVSPRTEPFQLAGFFDPDAPARPIRIGLPLDISPAGLRKFDKNTAFVMSDMLCGQVARFKGITLGDLVRSVLPFPLHKDLSAGGGAPCSSGSGSIGTICSLSIPIITICALILLIIIVTLLDIIFRWLPFFILCFPIPGLKGKKT